MIDRWLTEQKSQQSLHSVSSVFTKQLNVLTIGRLGSVRGDKSPKKYQNDTRAIFCIKSIETSEWKYCLNGNRFRTQRRVLESRCGS